jgi:hypothetical protein
MSLRGFPNFYLEIPYFLFKGDGLIGYWKKYKFSCTVETWYRD